MRAAAMLMWIGLWTIVAAADDPGRAVLVVFASDHPPQATGGVVAKAEIIELLFTAKPCPLPLQGAETMHRAWSVPGVIGCWYETIRGDYVFISPAFTRPGQRHVEAIPHALLHPDGTATITEPDYYPAWSAVREAEWAQKQVRRGYGQQP